MTDQSNPSAPKSPRRKPRREPATIDLPSTVVTETSPEPPPQPASSDDELIREAVAIEMAAPVDPATPVEPTVGDAPPLPPDDSDAEPLGMSGPGPGTPDAPRRPSLFLPMLAAALLGGVVGAGLLFALQDLRPPSLRPSNRGAGAAGRIASAEQRAGKCRAGHADAHSGSRSRADRRRPARRRRAGGRRAGAQPTGAGPLIPGMRRPSRISPSASRPSRASSSPTSRPPRRPVRPWPLRWRISRSGSRKARARPPGRRSGLCWRNGSPTPSGSARPMPGRSVRCGPTGRTRRGFPPSSLSPRRAPPPQAPSRKVSSH